MRSKHVKNDSLTGKDINEAKLRGVRAGPEVFAHIAADGTVDPARSRGISSANVSKDGSDTYCIGSLPFEPRGGQVTADYVGAQNDTHHQLGLGRIMGCPEGSQAWVWSFENDTGASRPSNFFILLYR